MSDSCVSILLFVWVNFFFLSLISWVVFGVDVLIIVENEFTVITPRASSERKKKRARSLYKKCIGQRINDFKKMSKNKKKMSNVDRIKKVFFLDAS